MAASKRVLVPIGTGSEEMEAVIIIDVLRRAGAEVTVASVEDNMQVDMSRGVKLVADKLIGSCSNEEYDVIALPGGNGGAERLRDSQELEALIEQQRGAGRRWAAVCASPAVVFQSKGWLEGKKATCHPAFVDRLADSSEADARVVVDGLLTTSRGPGTSFEFALALVEQLYGKDKAEEVAQPMVLPQGLDAPKVVA
ncbi:hypothetical protein WJX81_008205 [Elliptochloris bilobata]|uniref:DJ-1/PfpI domain-containing protein n=1 Tax=Elliptochloris bilobata TaxID=381761 RepID=A0AAW1RJD0_9CHLO